MDRTTEHQPESRTMNFDRPNGAPMIQPSHALMDAEAAAIVFGGKLFEGDNLFTVCSSIVRADQARVLAENAERTVTERPRHGRLLVEFLEPTTTAGEIAAVSEAMRREGIANVPAWELDERGVVRGIAIYAKEER